MPIFQTSTAASFTSLSRKARRWMSMRTPLAEQSSLIRGRHTSSRLRASKKGINSTWNSGSEILLAARSFLHPNTATCSLRFCWARVRVTSQGLATWLPRWWSHALLLPGRLEGNQQADANLGVRWANRKPISDQYGQTEPVNPPRWIVDRPEGSSAASQWAARQQLEQLQPPGHGLKLSAELGFPRGFHGQHAGSVDNGLRENFDEYLATASSNRLRESD